MMSWFSFLCILELDLPTPIHRLSPLWCPIFPNFLILKNGLEYVPHVTFVSVILFCDSLLVIASLPCCSSIGLIVCVGQQYQIWRRVERTKDTVYALESTGCLSLDSISALISVFRWTVYMSPNKAMHISGCVVYL